MLYLIHGDNIEASRPHLRELKTEAKGKEIRELDGRTLEPNMLTQALQASSLFGNDFLVVVENLLTKQSKNKSLEKMLKLLSESGKDTSIILWEGKEVTKTLLERLGKSVKAQLFKTPAIIFSFLDGLQPGQARQLLALYRQASESQPAEVIFVLLARRIRQLLMLTDDSKPTALAGWQLTRLTAQARLFTMEKLLNMYHKLLDIEVSIKTGASPFSLPQHIEQWLIDL